MQQDIQEKRTQETVKQVYEKPQFGRVRLFADQVLQTCSDSNCSDQNPAFNSGGN